MRLTFCSNATVNMDWASVTVIPTLIWTVDGDCSIENCSFTDAYVNITDYNEDGTASNVEFSNNVCFDDTYSETWIDIVTLSGTDLSVTDNIFIGGTQGVSLVGTSGLTFSDNTIAGAYGVGLSIYAFVDSADSSAVIDDNTVHSCDNYGIEIIELMGYTVTISDSVVWRCGGGQSTAGIRCYIVPTAGVN